MPVCLGKVQPYCLPDRDCVSLDVLRKAGFFVNLFSPFCLPPPPIDILVKGIKIDLRIPALSIVKQEAV